MAGSGLQSNAMKTKWSRMKWLVPVLVALTLIAAVYSAAHAAGPVAAPGDGSSGSAVESGTDGSAQGIMPPENGFSFTLPWPPQLDLPWPPRLNLPWPPPLPRLIELERAPIDEVELLPDPPQYELYVVSGIPSGCHSYHSTDVERDGNTITVTIWNRVMKAPWIQCTMIYRTHEQTIDLGSDFELGEEYIVRVNDEELTFVAESGDETPPEEGVRLSVQAEVVEEDAPVEVEATEVRETETGELAHGVRVTWRGEEPAMLDDARFTHHVSAGGGDLATSGRGCGADWQEAEEEVIHTCTMDLQLINVEPGDTHEYPIRVYPELGPLELTPGTYVVEEEVPWWDLGERTGEADGRFTIRLTYVVDGQGGNDAEVPQPVLDAVIADLAEREGVDPERIEVLRAVDVTWGDGCLGVHEPGEFCTQALVEGFAIWLGIDDQAFRYHTDSTGDAFRFAAGPMPARCVPDAPIPGEESNAYAPQPVLDAVIADLAEREQVDPERIEVLRAVGVTWRDGCLGVYRRGMLCTQALVEGFAIWLGIDDQAFRYHTDSTGNVVRFAAGPIPADCVPCEPIPEGAMVAS